MAARDDLRRQARAMMLTGTWASASMADVASAAGVSRQTLYNEYGSREGLATAVAIETAVRFREGTLAAAGNEADPTDAIAAAMRWALSEAPRDPIVVAALTDDATGLLPYITTRSGSVLPPIAADLAALIDRPGAPWACEVALRLTVSHLLSPSMPDDEFVDGVSGLLRPLFHEAP